MKFRIVLVSAIATATLILAIALIDDAVDRPIAERIENRAPSLVFQAWNGIGDATASSSARSIPIEVGTINGVRSHTHRRYTERLLHSLQTRHFWKPT